MSSLCFPHAIFDWWGPEFHVYVLNVAEGGAL